MSLVVVFYTYRDAMQSQDVSRHVRLASDDLFRSTYELRDQLYDIRAKLRELPDTPQRAELIQQVGRAEEITRKLDLDLRVLQSRFYSQLPDVSPTHAEGLFDSIAFVQSALAQSQPQVGNKDQNVDRRITQDDAKLYIMIFVFVILGITFIAAVIAIFFTQNPEILKFSFDTIKTLMGFFIGVGTAFLGIPTPPR
jgi:hypothetical protein